MTETALVLEPILAYCPECQSWDTVHADTLSGAECADCHVRLRPRQMREYQDRLDRLATVGRA